MAGGPVQLLVLGFNQPDFRGEVIAELERLERSDAVRVIDALAVHRHTSGAIEVEHLAGPAGALEQWTGGITMFTEREEWGVIDDIPHGAVAALILLEHRWAVPLRDAIARAGGYPISDGFISPVDLAEIGLMAAGEAHA